MTIYIDSEIEARAREVASRAGLPLEDYVRAALLRQMDLDEQRPATDALYLAFQAAAADPLFLEDLMDTEQAFASADADTARMLELGLEDESLRDQVRMALRVHLDLA